ncbi:TetR-like C-terminal domain-containing protein [Kribbella sp. NPDC056951]|uniref:TetR-like C-terminal domain-containing protein n=1 Tax=Kribbella sp. NPDC056951 TaxID=3345978 RepID=UPI00363492FF
MGADHRADPHRYLLIYGTPVPGYHAPADTTAISDQVMRVIVETAGDSATAVHRGLLFWTRLHGVLSLELAGHFSGMDVDPAGLVADEIKALRAGSHRS